MLRRLVVLVGLGLLIAGLLTVAETNVPETPGANVGGTLVVGVSQTFVDMDPRVASSVYDFYILDAVFDDLIALDPETLAPIPYVAKSWETAPDGSETTFYINEGITAHNGEVIDAHDVAYTFNWILDPANGSPNASEYEFLQEVVVIDDYTCKFIHKPDWIPYCPAIVSESTAIVPMDTCEEMGADAFNLHPIGSGPFKFVEWITGDHITLERNEDYWLVYPNLDKIVFRPIPNLATMMLELEAGGVDIVDNIPAQDVPRFQADPNVVVQQMPSLSFFHMGFNHSHLPSSDVRFRKAVGYSVDWDAAIFSIFQEITGIRAYGVIPAALWANDREYLQANAIEEDDEEAVRLFNELKAEGIIPEDFETTILCPLDPRRVRLSTILATNLQENGINAQVQSLDWGPLLDLLYRSEADPLGEDFEIYVMGWVGFPDPHAFIYYLFTTENATIGTANNFSWYSNPEVDRLVKEAATVPGCDQATREALYVEAQRIAFIEDVCDMTGYHYIETQGVNARVQGYKLNALGDIEFCSPFTNVWVGEISPGHPLTFEEAKQRVINKVIEPSSSREWADAYGLPEPLLKGAEVWPYLSEESVSIPEPTWFFWVDDMPEAMFAHPTRFVFIGAESNQLTVLQAQWWPVVDGESLWANVDERLDDPNNVYRGPFAFPDRTLYPREEPEASSWEQPLPALAVGGQALTYLASYTLQSGTGYAILVAGDNVGAFKRTVEAFYKHLKDVEKYNVKNIEALKPAKRASDIADAFERIKKRIKAGDTLIFFYAGHGGAGFAEIGKVAGIGGPKQGDSFWYDLKKDQEEYRFSIEGKQVQDWEMKLDKGWIDNEIWLKLEIYRTDYEFNRPIHKGGPWSFTVGKGSNKQEFRIRKVKKELLVFAKPRKGLNQNSLVYNLLKLPKGVNVIVILETCNAGSAIDLLKGNNIKAEVFTAADKKSVAFYSKYGLSDFTEWLLSKEGKGTKKGNWVKGFNYAKGMIGGKSGWYSGAGALASGRYNTKPQHAIIPATLTNDKVNISVKTGGQPLKGAKVTISGKDLTGKQQLIIGVTNNRGEFVTKVPRGLAYDITVSYSDKKLNCSTYTIRAPILDPYPQSEVFFDVRLTCTKLTTSP